MRFIWTKGPADEKPGRFVEVTDGPEKFHTELPDGFGVPENATLKHFAGSYAEWAATAEYAQVDRVVSLRMVNNGVELDSKFEFRLPLEDDAKVREIKTGNPVPAEDLVKDVAAQEV